MALPTDSRYVNMVTSRKVEQGQATRRELIAIATRLFVAHGYQGTSIEAVLREADISRGALYHHFDGKEALFEAVLDQVEADIAEKRRGGGARRRRSRRRPARRLPRLAPARARADRATHRAPRRPGGRRLGEVAGD